MQENETKQNTAYQANFSEFADEAFLLASYFYTSSQYFSPHAQSQSSLGLASFETRNFKKYK